MPTTRRRRLLKRACLWSVPVVLLLASYVTSYPVATVVLVQKRLLPPTFRPTPARQVVEFVYAPIIFYVDADLPGARPCQKYMQRCAYTFQQAIYRD